MRPEDYAPPDDKIGFGLIFLVGIAAITTALYATSVVAAWF